MVWQALAQRGQAKRTLIITPAGLTTQWQEELQDKFGRDFRDLRPRLPGRQPAHLGPTRPPPSPPSTASSGAEHKRILLENRKWDLIIFDEAHRLGAVDYGSGKVDKTDNYRLAEEVAPEAVQRGVPASDGHAAPGRGEPQPLQEPAKAARRRHRFQRAGGAEPVQRRGRRPQIHRTGHPHAEKGRDRRRGPQGLQGPADPPPLVQDVRRRAPLLRGRHRLHPHRLPGAGAARRRGAAAGGRLPADDVPEAQRQLDGGHPRRA